MNAEIAMNASQPALALRPRAAARALGVSERTLFEWTRKGEVPHVRHGRTVLYPVKALEAWLAASANSKREDLTEEQRD